MSVIQSFTIFLKYKKFVKKVCDALTSLSELYDIAIDKFETEIGDTLIDLYLEDKEFAVCCELEDLQQLYHGAIVEIRIKKSSLLPHVHDLHINTNCNLDETNPRKESLQHRSNEEKTELKTWSSIVSSTSTVSSSVSSPSTGLNTPRPQLHYVLLTGVPFTATDQDIISFFNPLQIFEPANNGIFFVLNYQRHRIGHVFVTFDNKGNYQIAFTFNDKCINGRNIQLLEGNRNDFDKCVTISNGINMRDFVENGSKRNHFFIKLKGFSFDIDEYRIREWLNNKSIVPSHVHIIYDHRNRNSGIAYLEFECKRNANRVFELNNEYLGCRYINVFVSTLSELRMHLAQLVGSALPHNMNPYLNCLRMDGVPHICKDEDIVTFFNDTLGIVPKQLYVRSTLDIAYVEFKTQSDSQLALTRNQAYIECSGVSSLVTLIQVSKYEVRSCVVDMMHGCDGNVDSNNKENVNMLSNNQAPLHRKKKRRRNRKNKQKHLVSIRGIPFDSDKQSVLTFFKGYDSTMDPKSLRFVKDHRGRFSGQATVAFYDKQEALQVVNELDRKYIGSRYVLLRLF